MGSERKDRIEMVASTLRRRWGAKALDTANTITSAPRVQTISTSFEALDEALGMGGIPRNHVTELLGIPTSGAITLALKVIASAQAFGEVAAYLDLGESLDADYAVRCGVDLTKLVLIRPQPREKSLDMLSDLVEKKGAGVIVFDSLVALSKPPNHVTSALRRINRALAESGCALIFVSASSKGLLSHEAALRLSVQRKHWLERHGDIYGYVSLITIAKNNFAPSGREVLVSLDFDKTVLGDAA